MEKSKNIMKMIGYIYLKKYNCRSIYSSDICLVYIKGSIYPRSQVTVFCHVIHDSKWECTAC